MVVGGNLGKYWSDREKFFTDSDTIQEWYRSYFVMIDQKIQWRKAAVVNAQRQACTGRLVANMFD